MDSKQLHKEVKVIFSDLSPDDDRLTSIEKAAFLELAHHLDLPDAQNQDTKTIVSGTGHYDLSDKSIDRLTSAVFIGTNNNPLDLTTPIEEFFWNYRAEATQGLPYMAQYYKKELWLYYIPDQAGTVYYTFQEIITDITEFPDNYFPLMVELMAMRLYNKPESPDLNKKLEAYRHAKDLIKSFKDRMHPKKGKWAMNLYRQDRITKLNEVM